MPALGAWDSVITLVAVINGLGVVRLLSALAEVVSRRGSKGIAHYWVYYALSGFQFMVHILFWWSMVGLREVGELNFLRFLYLLVGPTLLFLGSSLLIAEIEEERVRRSGFSESGSQEANAHGNTDSR